MKTLVLALGNPLLRDDGVAIRVAEELRRFSLDSEQIEIKTSSLSGLALLDEILGFEKVIILDAIQSGQRAVGEIFPIRIREWEGMPIGPSPHYLGLPSVLKWSRLAGLEAPREMEILGIEVKDPFTFDENLSAEVEAALPALVQRLLDKLGHPTE